MFLEKQFLKQVIGKKAKLSVKNDTQEPHASLPPPGSAIQTTDILKNLILIYFRILKKTKHKNLSN